MVLAAKMSSVDDAIETERAKSTLVYKEEVFPGLRLDMDLHHIFVTTQSPFQKIGVIETVYGRVSVRSYRLPSECGRMTGCTRLLLVGIVDLSY